MHCQALRVQIECVGGSAKTAAHPIVDHYGLINADPEDRATGGGLSPFIRNVTMEVVKVEDTQEGEPRRSKMLKLSGALKKTAQAGVVSLGMAGAAAVALVPVAADALGHSLAGGFRGGGGAAFHGGSIGFHGGYAGWRGGYGWHGYGWRGGWGWRGGYWGRPYWGVGFYGYPYAGYYGCDYYSYYYGYCPYY